MSWKRFDDRLIERAMSIVENNMDILLTDLAKRLGVGNNCSFLRKRLEQNGYLYNDKGPYWDRGWSKMSQGRMP